MNKLTGGMTYTVEHLRGGDVLSREVAHNLMPTQGMNYMLNAALKNSGVNSSWYVGIYEGDVSPVEGDTAADFPTRATECTAYNEVTREVLTLGTVAAGAVDNSASAAEFTMNATKSVYGCFIINLGTKGDTNGTVLLSAVRFSTTKSVISGDIIRVIGGFELSNAE